MDGREVLTVVKDDMNDGSDLTVDTGEGMVAEGIVVGDGGKTMEE